MLKLLEDMHMTHKKCVCCCHALVEDACKVLGCNSKLKLAFELLHKRTPWSVGMYLRKGGIIRYL
jgi:hypothetical protein